MNGTSSFCVNLSVIQKLNNGLILRGWLAMRSGNFCCFVQHVFQLLWLCDGQRKTAKFDRSSATRSLLIVLVVLFNSFWLTPLAIADMDARSQGEKSTSGDEASISNSDIKHELTLEEILNQDPQKEDYVEERNCISAHRIRNVKVLDEHHVVFNMRRNKRYLVQFKHRCFGLKPNKPISYEVNFSQVCKSDSIQGLETFAGRLQPGQRCRIPGFQSISEEQVTVLKETLKNNRQRAREERKARREAEHKARKAKRKV